MSYKLKSIHADDELLTGKICFVFEGGKVLILNYKTPAYCSGQFRFGSEDDDFPSFIETSVSYSDNEKTLGALTFSFNAIPDMSFTDFNTSLPLNKSLVDECYITIVERISINDYAFVDSNERGYTMLNEIKDKKKRLFHSFILDFIKKYYEVKS